MFKHYGLTGQTVKVEIKSGKSPAHPWGYAEQDMKIIMETPYFLTALVLPHRNPEGFGLSHLYVTTLHKHDIQIGEIILNGGIIK